MSNSRKVFNEKRKTKMCTEHQQKKPQNLLVISIRCKLKKEKKKQDHRFDENTKNNKTIVKNELFCCFTKASLTISTTKCLSCGFTVRLIKLS